jgi:hypothetical protein
MIMKGPVFWDVRLYSTRYLIKVSVKVLLPSSESKKTPNEKSVRSSQFIVLVWKGHGFEALKHRSEFFYWRVLVTRKVIQKTSKCFPVVASVVLFTWVPMNASHTASSLTLVQKGWNFVVMNRAAAWNQQTTTEAQESDKLDGFQIFIPFTELLIPLPDLENCLLYCFLASGQWSIFFTYYVTYNNGYFFFRRKFWVLAKLSWGSKCKPLYPATPAFSCLFLSSFGPCINNFSDPISLCFI